MGAIDETLRLDLLNPEFSEGYAESFQDAYVAAQIKVLREENNWTQNDLAREIGTTQTAISRIENVNYSSWNISTLKKLARAFRVRLKVSFETYGSLIHDFSGLNRESLKRFPREKDPELIGDSQIKSGRPKKEKRARSKSRRVPPQFYRARRKATGVPRKPPQMEAGWSPIPHSGYNPQVDIAGSNNNARPMPSPSNGNNSTSAVGCWQ